MPIHDTSHHQGRRGLSGGQGAPDALSRERLYVSGCVAKDKKTVKGDSRSLSGERRGPAPGEPF